MASLSLELDLPRCPLPGRVTAGPAAGFSAEPDLLLVPLDRLGTAGAVTGFTAGPDLLLPLGPVTGFSVSPDLLLTSSDLPPTGRSSSGPYLLAVLIPAAGMAFLGRHVFLG